MERLARFLPLSPLLVTLITTVDALYGPSIPVLQLNPSNFKSKVLNSNGVVLVEFFAPWCGHSKALTLTYEKVASVLEGVATVAALDADAHRSLAKEYGIKGFPTIKVLVPGKQPVDYQGTREVKSMVDFVKAQIRGLLKDRLDGKATGGSSRKSEPSASVELNSRNFDDFDEDVGSECDMGMADTSCSKSETFNEEDFCCHGAGFMMKNDASC